MQRAQTLMMGAAISLAALASLAPSPALAHATVVSSQPAANAELPKAPPAIILTFNEDVEPAFSSIALEDAAGKPLPNAGKAGVDAADKHVLKLKLEGPALASGGYIVRWVAVGPDGHRRSGQYQFSVK